MFAAKNLILASSQGKLAPTYAGVGAGHGATTATVSYVDTVPAGTTCALVWASHYSPTSSPTVSASVGGSSCTLVSTILAGAISSNSCYLSCFSLLLPPTGASKTVSFTTSSSSSRLIVINAVYYAGVTSVGSATTAASQTGQPSLAASSTVSNYLYANGFTGPQVSNGDTYSSYNQSQRYLVAQLSGSNFPMIFGDAVGNGSTLTFSATRSTTTYNYGGIIVPLIP